MAALWYSEDPKTKANTNYSAVDSRKLENAFNSGAGSCTLAIGGNTFTVDFGSMTQKNNRGGKRPVHRSGGRSTSPSSGLGAPSGGVRGGGVSPGPRGRTGSTAGDTGAAGRVAGAYNRAGAGGGATGGAGGKTGGGGGKGGGAQDPFEARIENEIVEKSPNVQWDDIASLKDAKRLLNEAVVLPMLMPSFFETVAPWKGVLLYGPPGTGKTLLAKAVATSGKTTFFNMSSSSLLSKYHGESEKMVTALFNKARELSPSTVFFDEVDALVSARSDGEHDASRRVKTELLSQVDGVSSIGAERVMMLATTNRPWDIDEAMRRRLEKRIYVPLPDAEARMALLMMYTKKNNLDPSVQFDELVAVSDGYSGADMQIMCRDAAMMPLRRAIAGVDPADLAQRSMELERNPDLLVVTHADYLAAIHHVKPSVSKEDLERYAKWTREFGST